MRLSFFEHFPALTLTLHEFSLRGSAPFENIDSSSTGEDSNTTQIKIEGIFITKNNLLANLKASLQLDDLAKAIPMKGYSFAGLFSTDFMANGRIQTPYYPAPIQNLEINGNVLSI